MEFYITVIILWLMKVIGKMICLMEKEFLMIIKGIEIIYNLFKELAKYWLLNNFEKHFYINISLPIYLFFILFS